MARETLGRGLSALMGDERSYSGELGMYEIDIDLIDPNPEQPRTQFSDAKLDELAASIRSNGIVQPIVLRSVGSRYQIVAGERRWRAAQRAELRRVPAVVREIPDDKLLEIALVENIQRSELNPIEEATAYRKLIDQFGLTQETISERVGKERTLITTTMRLLRLLPEVQQFIIEGALSLSHGRALLMTDDAGIQHDVARLAVEKTMSVRDTEAMVRRMMRNRDSEDDKTENDIIPDPNVKSAETKLMRKFSTNVKIVPARSGPGGKVELQYYGAEDLDRIYEMLMGPPSRDL